uniref:Uncharacterized protein n=1 Tax=Fusarium oxysporum (strain Fo5176) TaxID=660025 RepID=A0A0D2XKQ5_FUSOF
MSSVLHATALSLSSVSLCLLLAHTPALTRSLPNSTEAALAGLFSCNVA